MYQSLNFFTTRVISSLEKVFCRESLDATPMKRFHGAGNETVAFQLCCKAPLACEGTLSIDSELAHCFRIREVGVVPCLYPAHKGDPYLLTSDAGLFPDPLLPLKVWKLTPSNWHALWIDLTIPANFPPGVYPATLRLKLIERKNSVEKEIPVEIEVLPFALPPQTLINIIWFYADCLMAHYDLEAWEKRHWELLEQYFSNMTSHGINSIFTPLWSVPLDTAEGGERPTCQLLKISCQNGHYRFDFSRLARWIKLAKACGFEYFEMSHAFTQWGAKHAPKIIVRENGRDIQKFGWATDASSMEYRSFLSQLMERLIPFLKRHKLTHKNCFFHISDEPGVNALESYGSVALFFQGILKGYPVIDALSHTDFVHRGLIRRPVPSTNCLEEFTKEDLEQRWTYYCGNWWDGVPNRQLGMSSARCRIFGVMAYLYDLDGLLNWGYNFWFTAYSKDWRINPFMETNGGRFFLGGDPYLVYPGEDGTPVDSIRHEILREAMQDIRALRFLESLAGREKTLSLIQEGLWHKITITRYPHETEWLLDLRYRINREIVLHLSKNNPKRTIK